LGLYFGLKGMFFFAQGISLTSDQPGVVLLSGNSTMMQLSYSDPTQKVESVTIFVRGMVYTGEHCQISAEGTTIALVLPNGEMAGSSVTVQCKRFSK